MAFGFATDPDVQAFPAGYRFFAAGDEGDVMYMVMDGEVEIRLRGTLLETVRGGGIFGEMAIIDLGERSAEAVAKSNVVVVTMDRQRFLYLVGHDPTFALDVMKTMAARLRRMDHTV